MSIFLVLRHSQSIGNLICQVSLLFHKIYKTQIILLLCLKIEARERALRTAMTTWPLYSTPFCSPRNYQLEQSSKVRMCDYHRAQNELLGAYRGQGSKGEDDARNIAAQTGLYWKFTNDDSRSGHGAAGAHRMCVHTLEDLHKYMNACKVRERRAAGWLDATHTGAGTLARRCEYFIRRTACAHDAHSGHILRVYHYLLMELSVFTIQEAHTLTVEKWCRWCSNY